MQRKVKTEETPWKLTRAKPQQKLDRLPADRKGWAMQRKVETKETSWKPTRAKPAKGREWRRIMRRREVPKKLPTVTRS